MNKQPILWILGPTSSGKTTLSKEILKRFRLNGNSAIHFDGDEVREFFGSNLGFDDEDRLRVVKTIAHLANKSFEAGLTVIVSALTANQDARDYIRKNVKNLVIIFLDCGIKKCIQRDCKGLYKKAIDGKIQTVIGINREYLPISKPDIVIDTENMDLNSSAKELLMKLNEKGLI